MSRFALVDGNNFYVSCERVFNPRLEDRPVVVDPADWGGWLIRAGSWLETGIIPRTVASDEIVCLCGPPAVA